MTLERARGSFRRNDASRIYMPRLRLKPKASSSGFVDGAWWPRTHDLTGELPDLIAVLSSRLGTIDRVMYNIDEWAAAPAELDVRGQAVVLDGCPRELPNTLEVIAVSRNRIVLLVIPLETDPGRAHAIVMAAAMPNNFSHVRSLLMISSSTGRATLGVATSDN
jgi:Family of unknown function (DUF5994)